MKCNHPSCHALKRLTANPSAIIGIFILSILMFCGIFASIIAPMDPLVISSEKALQSYAPGHILGTDQIGRDVLSRIIHGAAISLQVGLLSRITALFIGLVLGLIAGYAGGFWDQLIMRITDIFFSFPALLFLIGIVAVFPPSLTILFLAIGIVSWPGIARLMRAQVLVTKENEYILAARAAGYGQFRIMFRHVLPNCLTPLIITFTMGMGTAIIAESSLSFIGLGAPPPLPSWGSMIADSREYLRSAPYLSIYPGLAISITVLGFNILGDAVRDAFDPQMKIKKLKYYEKT